MIIRPSDSTLSFSVVVKVPTSHPSDPGSIPASIIFYNLFLSFFFLFFFNLGFTARQYYFTHFEPNRKVGRRTPRKTTWPSTSRTAGLTRDTWQARILSIEMFLIFFLLFEFYITLMDGRFPVKMLIFTIGVIIKTFPQRQHCTLALECQEFV